jgi:hypothetical protein
VDYLQRFAEAYGLQKIVKSITNYPNVQGAILTLDDWWLTSWRWQESGRSAEQSERLFWRRREWGPRPYPFIDADPGMNAPPWIPQRPPDLNWRPPYWEQICHMVGREKDMPPVRLIVCLLPPARDEGVTIPELPQVYLPVSFEVRPVARLAADHRGEVRPLIGGVSIGMGTHLYGTLGGIVEDQNKVRYGVTCAHVFPAGTPIDQPALHDDARASAIGSSTTDIDLQQCPNQGPCNPYTGSPHIAAVDTRLVEFHPEITSELEILSVGPLAGVVRKNSMTPGQSVTFVGRTSGNRVAEIGGLAVFYRFQMKGKAYCFRDLFEIRWRSLVAVLLGPVVQAGDSGAWVCTESDQGPAWCGQIIGEDRHVGYATFAENTVQAWSNAHKKDLRVV